jgi:hypothetical protein
MPKEFQELGKNHEILLVNPGNGNYYLFPVFHEYSLGWRFRRGLALVILANKSMNCKSECWYIDYYVMTIYAMASHYASFLKGCP